MKTRFSLSECMSRAFKGLLHTFVSFGLSDVSNEQMIKSPALWLKKWLYLCVA
jgi:hypothetical protein